MKKTIDFFENLSEWIGKAAAYLVLPVVFLTVYMVVARYFFHISTAWGFEISIFLYGLFFMLSGAYTLKLKGHVAVDIIARFVPPRGKQILDLATSLLIIFFCAIMIWQGTKTAYQSMMVWETSNNTAFNPPVWWFRWIIPISAALILLQSIADFLKTLLTPGKGGADSGS